MQVKFDAPHLQLWKPVKDNFICIEPWYGHNDAWYDAPSNVENKKGIIKLESGKIWSTTMELSFKLNKKA